MKSVDDIRVVTVLGAGTMGAGIAQVAAQAGYETRLYDISDELVGRGLDRVRAMLDKGVARGKVAEADRDATLARLRGSADLPEAVAGADVVVEAAPEDLALKRRIFGAVAAVVDEACLLATNTSSLSVSQIAAPLPAPARFLGLHFFNPPPLMKLLEIVVGEATGDEALATARALALRLGKDPIVVRDSPGFASSRLGLALGLEAIRMVEEGVASPEDIDKAMKLGYRHPMGPLELTDLVGLDVRLAIAGYLASTLDDRRFAPPALLRRLVEEGRTGQKAGEGFYRWVDGRPEPREL
ncbi:MAG: 3-hydroxyacyl-CoA dehydrogenase family protein [Planctomycetota bacterium]